MFLALETSPTVIVVVDKIVLVTGFYLTVLVIAWQVFRIVHARAEVQKAHAEVRNRLLGMVSSLDELMAFARTAEGRRLLEPPTPPSEAVHGLHLIEAGIVVLGLAVGVGVVSRLDGVAHAVLVGLVGVGLVAAGAVGRWLRSRWVGDTEA
jgi:DMSO reductase anchor subunit